MVPLLSGGLEIVWEPEMTLAKIAKTAKKNQRCRVRRSDSDFEH